jgi:hypothetical protein
MLRIKPERILIKAAIGQYNKFGLEISILILVGSYNSLRDAKIRRYHALISKEKRHHINMVHEAIHRSY